MVSLHFRVLMHLHSPYVSALGNMKDPKILMCHQNSARFCGRVAYEMDHSDETTDEQEGERLGKIMGDKDVLMMCNHGALVAAANVHQAFEQVLIKSMNSKIYLIFIFLGNFQMYFLERACMVQMLAMSADGRENLTILEASAAQDMLLSSTGASGEAYAWRFFSACWNEYVEDDSDVFD